MNHPEIELDEEYRKKMLTAFKTENDEPLKSEDVDDPSREINYYSFSDFDPNTGYLYYANYARNEGVCITYWNQTDGNKLVGISKSYEEHPSSQEIEFYVLRKDGLFVMVSKYRILPSLRNIDYLDLDKLKERNINPDSLINAYYRNHDLYYIFPEEGKNIRVISQILTSDGYDGEFSEYELGSVIELIWDDGKFKKGGFVD
ncbi:hypothetical protein [Flammeovirga aprica]|uniref:Uncharacterized protein n=1 Tax=Flammeovirga aprica JL-4 TaxID=694437 RepID=A0A7X9S034_9BACT|nr:hypothetical protein [Flammeovirga aprica]NME71896.1 hypothetical protein [Flammeovirga aprica JL-4]